jgi:hypothetical protein
MVENKFGLRTSACGSLDCQPSGLFGLGSRYFALRVTDC